jgi:hypothetical protein
MHVAQNKLTNASNLRVNKIAAKFQTDFDLDLDLDFQIAQENMCMTTI